MAAGSLFDRLTRGEAGARMDEDESIRLHLLRMFTARQGSVQALPEYGLPDINDLTLSRSELLKTTCEAIKTCIERYEPRLTRVAVTHVPGGSPSSLTMEFHLTATIVNPRGEQIPWEWNILLDWDQIRGRA